jgi:hypothetical protein
MAAVVHHDAITAGALPGAVAGDGEFAPSSETHHGDVDHRAIRTAERRQWPPARRIMAPEAARLARP